MSYKFHHIMNYYCEKKHKMYLKVENNEADYNEYRSLAYIYEMYDEASCSYKSEHRVQFDKLIRGHSDEE
ncbi:MAG: hypothetical protein P4L79_10215 [Legionella sp.]|uniref:hypothetical protein n=1 Tax=Legionella sp. TaxID=459 RepID=UPI00283D7F80|nr:hypothetical protein [Legionella sp.]